MPSIYSLLQNNTFLYYWEILEAVDRLVIQPILLSDIFGLFDNLHFSNVTTLFDKISGNVNVGNWLSLDYDFIQVSQAFFQEHPVFDEFQWKLCKILGFIVLTNLALIYLFWSKVYGEKIIEKFMQPASSTKLIEELKNSISELKLPKEHSPRL